MNNQSLLEKIYDRMAAKNTDELIAIWIENDHGLWSKTAFQVIQDLLIERGVPLPNQRKVKVTIPPPPRFEIPWQFPYLSWTALNLPRMIFGVFLAWVFLIHPFFFFTRFDGPLWPEFQIKFAAFDLSQNIEIYGKLYFSLHIMEFGIMSYGILVGYFVLRKSSKVVSMVKIYLIEFLLFSIFLILFFNLAPMAIFYWEIHNSIFDLEPDWKTWNESMRTYSMGPLSRWGFFLETFKVYWLPISASIFWYIFLIRSKWLAKTFPLNPRSAFQEKSISPN